jgi:hypothetical protein
MAKNVPDTTLDVLPTKIATAVRLSVCASEPANYAAIAAATLANVALTPGNGNGDFTIANGDTNGRKVTVLAQNAIPITSSGTANHVVLDDGSAIILITTCTAQALTSGGTVSTPAFDDEVADAA